MKRRKILGMLLGAGLLLQAGCVHIERDQQVLLDQATRARLKTETNLRATIHQPTRFYVITREVNAAAKTPLRNDPVTLAFTLGDEMVRMYRIEDPGVEIKMKALEAIVPHLGGREIPSIDSDVDPDQTDQLDVLQRRFGSGLLLDFQTAGWGIMQFNAEEPDFNHVVYYMRARLIDLTNKALLWQTACEIRNAGSAKAATLAELKANSGEPIKKRLKAVVDSCVPVLESQFLLERPRA